MQYQYLLKKYGGGREFTKIKKIFNKKDIIPSNRENIKLMKQEFKGFKYNCEEK